MKPSFDNNPLAQLAAQHQPGQLATTLVPILRKAIETLEAGTSVAPAASITPFLDDVHTVGFTLMVLNQLATLSAAALFCVLWNDKLKDQPL